MARVRLCTCECVCVCVRAGVCAGVRGGDTEILVKIVCNSYRYVDVMCVLSFYYRQLMVSFTQTCRETIKVLELSPTSIPPYAWFTTAPRASLKHDTHNPSKKTYCQLKKSFQPRGGS